MLATEKNLKLLNKNIDARVDVNVSQIPQSIYPDSRIIQFFELRKEVFCDKLEWDLFATDRVEIDQYDNNFACYVTLQIESRVVAGVRLTPTTATTGEYSYLLRDATLGRIPNIPSNIVSYAPQSRDIWEGTRLVISNSIISQDMQKALFDILLKAIFIFLSSRKARFLLTISPLSLHRQMSALTNSIERLGPIYRCLEDNRLYAAYSTEIQS